ncbi:hypothetical protein [Paenarthrobacter nicotinovorans]|uniref:hypothetical protein n=1 Tax=Paenarthrobacter nicotinovorans TaxID=29320 RepID=UPI0004B59F2B|nr:hypothetical protein [Paenarthrobacter nicotinovorans]
MDLLSTVSPDQLPVFIWVATAVFVIAGGIFQPRRFHWTALGAVVGFAALNAVAGLYVLNHYADPRWSSQAVSRLSAPSLADTPLGGQFMGPLDSALVSVVTGVSEFLAFKEALPVALDFMATAGWALLVSFPVAVITVSVSFMLARRCAASFEKYKVAVDVLKVELEALKRQIEAVSDVRTSDADTDAENAVVQAMTDISVPSSLRPVG